MHVLYSDPTDCSFETEIDASGKSVIPGLVDAHTHPVWEGDRVHEFAMKVSEHTKQYIHQMHMRLMHIM